MDLTNLHVYTDSSVLYSLALVNFRYRSRMVYKAKALALFHVNFYGDCN